MALALRDAAALKPEVQLSRALRDFESVLNVAQKQQLDLYKLETAPGPGAPLKLASWLDCTLRARRSRHCMGPRVVNLLQSTQQFASIIDVVVGGSQNLIASGVWGVLKLALLAGMNYSAHFDKLTQLLMEVGRTCPRYEEMESLFTESRNLRKALYSYFAAVIDLCRCIVSFQQKPFWAKLPGMITPFDASFLQVKARIERFAVEIKEEVIVAMVRHQKQEAALQSEERKENARHRILAARFREESLVEARKKERRCVRSLKRGFLHLLSDYDPTPAWKQARSRGTVRWILGDDTYQCWKENPLSRVLHLSGHLGSGKTVVMANMVSDVSARNRVAMSYMFCRFDDGRSLEARTIIGSLARQLLCERDFPLPKSLPASISIDDILDVLCKSLPSADRINIICVDGLDDCDENERYMVVSFLESLIKEPHVITKIMYSSRGTPHLEMGDSKPHERVLMQREDTYAEVADYIRHGLEQRLQSKRITLQDPNLKVRIQRELEEKAKGMYLWVHLQLESLCERVTDAGIVATLETLPLDLCETYARILSRIKLDMSLVTQIFQITAVVERPLSADELREAIAIEPGKLDLPLSSLITDISGTIPRCGSLLEIDEEDCSVRFIHRSVRQFLLDIQSSSKLSIYRIVPEEASLDLGVRCVTYLNLGVFNTTLTKLRNTERWEHVSPAKILKNTLHESPSAKVALMFLNTSSTTHDISQHVERLTVADPVPKVHAFFSYAQSHVFTHTKRLLQCSAAVDSLFCNTFNGSLPFMSIPWRKDELHPGLSVLQWSIQCNHLGLAFRILRGYTSKMGNTSYNEARDLKDIPIAILEACLQQSLQLKRYELLHMIFEKASVPEKTLLAILPLIITNGETIFRIWERKLYPHSKRLQINIQKISLQPLGIIFWPRKARIRFARLQVVELPAVEETDLLTLAAASNNQPAVSFLMLYGVLEFKHDAGGSWTMPGPPNSLWLPMILSALREAACRDNASMFRHLFSLYPFHKFREHPSEISPRECDDFQWTPLDYAAMFRDLSIYEDLRAQSYPMELSIGTLFPPALIRSLAMRRRASIFRPDGTEKEVFEEPPSAFSTEKEAITSKAPTTTQINVEENTTAESGFFRKWFSRTKRELLVDEDLSSAAELAANCIPPIELPIEPERSVQLATEPLPAAVTQKLASLLGQPSARGQGAVIRQDDRTFGVSASKLKGRFLDESPPTADEIATLLESPVLEDADSPALVELDSPVTDDYRVNPHGRSDKKDKETSPRKEDPVNRTELARAPLKRRVPPSGLFGKSQLRIEIPKPNVSVTLLTSLKPTIPALEGLEKNGLQETRHNGSPLKVQPSESKSSGSLATDADTSTTLSDACDVGVSGTTEGQPPKADASATAPEPIDSKQGDSEDNEIEEISAVIQHYLSEAERPPFSPGLSSSQFSGFEKLEETPRTSISSARSVSFGNLPKIRQRQDTFDHLPSPSDFKSKESPPLSGRLRRKVKRGVYRKSVQYNKRVYNKGVSWWENPLLVFLVFVLWPSILACLLIYYLQNMSRNERITQQRTTPWYSILRAFGI